MNNLTQLDNYLIATQSDLDSLSKKNHARILLISDSHGAVNEFSLILERFGPTCDALFFCGDGAADLIKLLEISQNTQEKKKELPPVIAIVRGNGDSSSYPLKINNEYSEIKIPSNLIVEANGKKFFITHGHNEYVDYSRENLGLKLQLKHCDYACYGHTHISSEERMDDFTFINPGSICRPRSSSPYSFAILTVERTFLDCAFLEIKKEIGNKRNYKIYTPLF